MVAEKQNAINTIFDEIQTFPVEKVFAVRDYVITLKQEKPASKTIGKRQTGVGDGKTKSSDNSDKDNGYKIPSVEQRKKALAALMKFKGSIDLPEDRDAAKEEYLRSKYESLN